MRILLKVAYDGTAYHGWQVQPGESATIEGVLNRCLSELTHESIEVIGASRTDAGVHSMGNLAVFDTESSIPPESFMKALNGRLPWDIRIMESRAVDSDFHPRHMDTQKTYRYRIYHGDIMPPCERLYAHHVYGPIDTEAMKKAAKSIIGEHDFSSFCAAGSQAVSTVRTVYDCRVECTSISGVSLFDSENEEVSDDFFRNKADEYIDIYVTGSGFLYNMVRIIAGTLLAVGRGQISADYIGDIIEKKNRALAGPTLPAMGLRLEGYKGI